MHEGDSGRYKPRELVRDMICQGVECQGIEFDYEAVGDHGMFCAKWLGRK